MKHKTLLAAGLAAGSLMSIAGIAQAAPAVVAGTTPYGNTGSVPYYGNTGSVPYYGGPQVYTHPGQAAVIVQGPPPAPIYESVPSAREGYVWAPGHYVWENGRYHWRAGEWVASRPGYAWQSARWEQRSDGSWHLVSGHWVRTDNVTYDDRRGLRGPNGDLDGDGIRNADDRDRDGDGVANRNDDFPNNPNRS